MSEYKILEAKYVCERNTWPAGSHGDVGYWMIQGDLKRWMMACPRCGNVVGLYNHDVNVDAGGLVTIRPSVGHTACRAHFYVKAGKIQVLGDM